MLAKDLRRLRTKSQDYKKDGEDFVNGWPMVSFTLVSACSLGMAHNDVQAKRGVI